MTSILKPELNIILLCREASVFAAQECNHAEPSLYGVTDGKAVGTYFEHKFQIYLRDKYTYTEGNSAKGIDFPELNVDMKVTSIKQPQSSCPFKSAKQKIFGLGYALLIFVYEKVDDPTIRAGRLNFIHAVFLEKERTADFQTTTGILRILENQGNRDDLLAFFEERRLPIDEIEAMQLANELLQHPPMIGYLTISNALQWRLQYSRVIEQAGQVDGLRKIR